MIGHYLALAARFGISHRRNERLCPSHVSHEHTERLILIMISTSDASMHSRIQHVLSSMMFLGVNCVVLVFLKTRRSHTKLNQAKVLRSGVDSTHPPPLPSGTPGTQSDAPPQGSHEQTQRRKILGGKGTADSLNTEGGVGNAVTEGFAIEESEAEGSHHPGISREEIAIFAELENKKVGEKQDR